MGGSPRETRVGASETDESAAPPPLALISRTGSRRTVVSVDELALTRGVQPGMAATMAQALVADLETLDADPDADAASLHDLALWALRRYAPVVAADIPDGLMIDLTGAAHLRGGEHAAAKDVVTTLGAAGVTARVAVAATYGAAHALARYVANPVMVATEAEALNILERLPVGALRLSGEIVEGLRKLGFDRIGELAATPRAPLALRFGSDIGRRLDQMFGRSREPFALVSAPELIRVSQGFAEPIAAAETIARYIAKLVDRLCDILEERALGARKLDLLFGRVDSEIQAVRVGTAKPVRDRKQPTRLLCDRIQTVSPGFGIETMWLSAPIAEPLDYRAVASSLVDAAAPDVSELVDILGNRVGDGRLYRVTAVESDVPERSTRRVAALAAPTDIRWPLDWPRPTRLLTPPERIETVALLPDHPPASFTWRGVRRRIRRADGPERIFGEWRKRDAELNAVRDYFQVEDEAGARFWLFRSGDGVDAATGSHDWFIHGLFA